MKIIKHRVNATDLLSKVPRALGVEIDVRYHNSEIVLDHDPFHSDKCEIFSDYLNIYNCEGPLIVNLKSEGIEETCINIIKKFKIKDWFFLDMSLPFLVKISNNLDKYGILKENLAVRFSDKEPIELALNFENHVGWVWVDTFKTNPLNHETYEILKNAGFRICLVSPELHGRDIDVTKDYRKEMTHFKIDAVCTKLPNIWKN